MSKWNKNNKKQLSDEFIQNEERRKQMIIEAAKRRREKQRKLQQLNEQLKKKQEKALEKHKQEKKDAYVKYLRNNMHDKYENMKQKQKMNEQGVKQVSKWKRKAKQEDKILEGLGLQVQFQKEQIKPTIVQKKNNQSDNKKKFIEEFEKQWKDDEVEIQEIIGSKLIDSLDLDIATMERGHQYNLMMRENESQNKQQEKQISEVRDLIGYESILFSIDQRKDQKKEDKVEKKNEPFKKLKNQQQAFNELKNKKEGKLLNWANEEAEEANDLFSNCSSKRSGQFKAPIEEIKKEKMLRKVLEPIPQKKGVINKSFDKNKQTKMNSLQNQNPNEGRQRSHEKKVSTQKKINNTAQEKPKRNTNVQNTRNKSQEKRNVVRTRQVSSFSRQKSRSHEKLNKQQEKKNEKAIPKTQQNFTKRTNPPLPVQPNYTVATHEQHFEIQSFIKNDLMQINKEERKLQEELRSIHQNKRNQIKNIEEKHQIRTDYKNTKNLIKHHEGENENQSEVSGYAAQYKQPTQDQIEESIQKLDDLLIKRDIQSREKTLNHISQQSYSLLDSNSLIDPFSKPSDFQKQILQLASNISKIQNETAQESKDGYGFKKKNQKKKNSYEEIVNQSKKTEDLSVQKKKSTLSKNMPRPPILQYSAKNQTLQQQNFLQNDDFEDSLETMAKEKIQVNEKLKNLLFDD